MRKRRAPKIAAAELTDAKPTAKHNPKQKYYATDARRAYMRNLMRKRRAAARGALMTGQREGIDDVDMSPVTASSCPTCRR
jgi:hypothetical protein